MIIIQKPQPFSGLNMLLTFILFNALLISCGSDDASPGQIDTEVLAAPASVSARDIANNGNASDLQINFTKPSSTSLINEFKLFIVSASEKNNFDSLVAVNNNFGIVVSKSTSGIVQLQSTDLDADGDAVIEGKSYVVFGLSVGIDQLGGALSAPSDEFILEQKSAVRTLTSAIQAGSGGMDTDSDGNIYMGDFGATLNGGGSRVVKISPDGVVSTFATGLNGASGNDFDSEGNLYQSSITGGFISKISPTGSVEQYASAGLNGPVGVVVAPDGSLFVADCGSNSIKKVDTDGTVTVFSQSSLLNNACPNGIDMDADGNLYIALFSSGNIVKIDTDGEGSVFASIPGSNNGHLLIKDNTMYVVARGSHLIYTVDMSTQSVNVFAGNGTRGLGNGALDEASFSFPNDLAFSPDGSKLYINDVDPGAGAQNNLSPVYIRVIDIVE